MTTNLKAELTASTPNGMEYILRSTDGVRVSVTVPAHQIVDAEVFWTKDAKRGWILMTRRNVWGSPSKPMAFQFTPEIETFLHHTLQILRAAVESQDEQSLAERRSREYTTCEDGVIIDHVRPSVVKTPAVRVFTNSDNKSADGQPGSNADSDLLRTYITTPCEEESDDLSETVIGVYRLPNGGTVERILSQGAH